MSDESAHGPDVRLLPYRPVPLAKPCDRSDLSLGIEVWARQQQSNALRLAAAAASSGSEEECSRDEYVVFRTACPPDEKDDAWVQDQGKTARQLGVCSHVKWTKYTLLGPDGCRLDLHAPPDFDIDTWSKLDLTFPLEYNQGIVQPTHFMRWIRNSCPLDACMDDLLARGAVIRQGDQLPLQQWLRLPPPAMALRLVLSTHWQHLRWDPNRRALVDILHDTLTNAPDIAYIRGQFHDANEVKSVLVEGGALPSQTTVLLESIVCCDGLRIFRRTTQREAARTQWVLALEAPDGRPMHGEQPLCDVLTQTFFEATDRDSDIDADPNRRSTDGSMRTPHAVCSRGGDCTQMYTREPVVLERLAPELDVHIAGGAEMQQKGRKWFSPLSVSHQVIRKQAKQDIEGDIAMTDTGQPGEPFEEVLVRCDYTVVSVRICKKRHFTTYVKDLAGGKPGISCLDGLEPPQGEAQWVANTWEEAFEGKRTRGVKVMAVTYKICKRYMEEYQ